MSEQVEPIRENLPTFTEVDLPEKVTAARRGFDGALSEGKSGGFSTVERLKLEAPEVYDGIMESIAREICNESKRASDRIKAAMREGEDRR